MAKTSIQWTDFSLNPIRARLKDGSGHHGHFCEKISPGCKLCYSSKLQSRFNMLPFLAENRDKVEIYFERDVALEVLKRKKPTKWFWCDMTDMFLDGHMDEWLDFCFAVMALTPWHIHQVLTKRPGRMLDYLTSGRLKSDARVRVYNRATLIMPSLDFQWPLPNVWLGVSVEDQKTAEERIPLLLQTPAAVRWVSYEPALGPVDFSAIRWETQGSGGPAYVDVIGRTFCTVGGSGLRGPGLDWLVCGGESGPGARPFNLDWARSVIAQCKTAGVPCFVKQLGSNAHWFPHPNVELKLKGVLHDRKGGDITEFPPDLQVREYPA